MCLIAASGWGNTVLMIVQAAIGLGAVIFVHELGHFLVAKMCGVKCEKFYIGFDVPLKFGKLRLPSAFWKKQWGETEYGIGVLPLGGYVKMLGQDDNPGKIAEAMQESRVEGDDATKHAKEIVGPDGETYWVDRRSYLAKSVPQRMAIISAGVIMNVIFAFIFAVIAYGIGVPYTPCTISATTPGSPAWRENLQAGDEIVELNGKADPMFDDLRSGVMLSNLKTGVAMKIRRHSDSGSSQEHDVVVKAKQGTGLAMIGVAPARSLRLSERYPSVPFTPAANAKCIAAPDGKEASGDLLGGDEIIRVGDEAVENYAQLTSLLAQHRGDKLRITVRRGGNAPADNPFGPREGGEEWTFEIEPRPVKRFGLVMQVGPVVAVQDDSPADSTLQQRIEIGDRLEQRPVEASADADAQPVGITDPLTWPEEMRRLAQQPDAYAKLELVRPSDEGEDEHLAIDNLRPREVNFLELSPNRGAPMSCPALGIAYRVINRVHSVIEGSPAAEAGFKEGDEIIKAELKIGDDAEAPFDEDLTLEFGKDQQNWPALMSAIQDLSPQTTVNLTVRRAGASGQTEEKVIEVAPQALSGSPLLFNALRGFNFEFERRIRIADSFASAVSLGYTKTVDSLGLVYRFLDRLINGQVPLRALGGPITIAKASYYSAFEGMGKLLIFLTLLSANLAVINFLPIPLLDGGHMVFLFYEGIRRRPPGEKFVVAMHMVGFAFIVSLMLFVFALDLGFIPRNL